MAEPVSLAVVKQLIEELVGKYEATNSDDPQAADILAELSRLIGLSTALRRIRQETKHVPKNRLAIARAGFPTIEALYTEMDNMARQIAETPRSQHRIELIDQLTRLCLLADSANKEKE